ncbi:MAG TPA: acyltransferase [Terriglobales bacterium]|nr:acyltransferase [Terriglobales bacterium]
MSNAKYFKHPQALVESVEIGEGTRIWAFAHVLEGARVGKECNLCDHVFVESNVEVGDHVTIKNGVALWDGVVLENGVFVGPNAVFTNDKNPRATVRKGREEFLPTRVREGASIGANATIVCGNTIGRHAFVAAGAVVTRDVEDYAMVVGVPARKVGYMCECGEILRTRLACGCGRKFIRKNGQLLAAPTNGHQVGRSKRTATTRSAD